MNYRERITIEPGKRGGKPCIRSLRITVYDILDYLAAGMTPRKSSTTFQNSNSPTSGQPRLRGGQRTPHRGTQRRMRLLLDENLPGVSCRFCKRTIPAALKWHWST